MTSSILWQNIAKTITLIDIPQSIAAAQGAVQNPCHDELLSTNAVETPFTTNEPKTAAKIAKLTAASGDHELHERYAAILRDGLAVVKTAHERDWCLPRTFVVTSTGKRKREETDTPTVLDELVATESSSEDITVTATIADGPEYTDNYCRLAHRANQDDVSSLSASLDDKLVYNREMNQATIRMRTTSETGNIYRVPPRSSFYLGDCHSGRDFRIAIRAQAEHEDSCKDFDFILLDPPWPNRSVRRTHKTPGSTYSIAPNLNEVEDLLFGMDLDMLMADDCLVGLWITNKPAAREMVLGEGGLFASWGVQLCEEWVWLKTTIHGEPITPIEATWRKPYEVLLLGRKRCIDAAGILPVQTKIIVGVPDLHSRKPCLRELMEPLVPNKENYRALEVFARYLVAGWCSWGNECIKFNSTEHWKSRGSKRPRPSNA
ncbi:hypothetical protein LTR78_002245 [Recurvomyces mirabilis]|uniref:MT-A70-domain-containing protein n=1 Tax=Recurvomyces mirabilis TaxID=574656 RepID=A0AAE0WU02_9PEZI|nr:hypothetical protein LTR78_002245 [Recurvomyces mirabilis]KAK5160700.1 hypothetical protein LTS14_001713 [Recurvomyces mirabilis]